MSGHRILTLTALMLLIPASASAAELTVIQKNASTYSFVVTASPKAREPGRRVTVTLDLAQTPIVPDPTFGDRVPVRGASVIATVKREGGTATRYGLHPLMGAGVYGFHFTPSGSGLYHIAFTQRGVELPELDFQLGVGGVATPADAEAPKQAMGLRNVLAGERRAAVGTMRGPITPTTASNSARKAMEAMSAPAGILGEALAKKKPLKSEIDPLIEALLVQARTLKGTVPDPYRSASAEYDQLSEKLVADLEVLKKKASAGPKQVGATRAAWAEIRDSSCAGCHVKFWWAITPDLSTWPKITPQAWKR